jgi:hypothetical protein
MRRACNIGVRTHSIADNQNTAKIMKPEVMLSPPFGLHPHLPRSLPPPALSPVVLCIQSLAHMLLALSLPSNLYPPTPHPPLLINHSLILPPFKFPSPLFNSQVLLPSFPSIPFLIPDEFLSSCLMHPSFAHPLALLTTVPSLTHPLTRSLTHLLAHRRCSFSYPICTVNPHLFSSAYAACDHWPFSLSSQPLGN